MNSGQKKIEDVLIDLKLISSDQWQQIIEESKKKNLDPEKIILDQKILSSEVLTKSKAIAYKVPYVDLNKIQIPEEIQDIIPEQASQKYQMVPFAKDMNVVKVAMVDPTDFKALDYLRARIEDKIEPHIANPEDINNILGGYQSFNLGSVLDSIKETEGAEDIFRLTKQVALEPGKIQADSTPVVQLVNNIFQFSITNKSSDIHIEPFEIDTRVRCRIDGILQELTRFPNHVHPAIVSRIKIMSNMKIDEKRIPQDGRISLKVGKKEFDLRVSTLPTIFGEKIVIRLLAKSEKILSLEELGFRGRGLELTKKAFERTWGMFLSTGPTGSGKSTTLYSALKYLNTPTVNTVTLEDPVEHVVGGVNQTQINPTAGLTFGSGLRSIVRQDPDIIMVGEIRDQETAGLAINAALTGHFVLSTLHTNTAAAAIPRLIDIGVEPFLISSTLNIIVAQRLLRKLCEECKEEIKASENLVQLFNQNIPFIFDRQNPHIEQILSSYPNALKSLSNNSINIFKSKGCNLCKGSGYRGRIGIYEILELSEAIQKLTIEKATEREIKQTALQEGMFSLMQEGFLRVLEGVTTIEEVLRVAA